MEESKRYVRLGLFVFVALIVAAAILFILGGRSLFQPTYTFETYFNQSVAGLDIGAPVKFRGVPTGEVTEIVTASAAYEADVPIEERSAYIVVRAKVTGSEAQVRQWRQEAEKYVSKGFRVQTQLAGITGQQYLALDYLDPQKFPPFSFGWKPKYPYVPSAPSLTGEIIANAQQFLANLNQADIQDLGQNLSKLVVTLNQKASELQVGELARMWGRCSRTRALRSIASTSGWPKGASTRLRAISQRPLAGWTHSSRSRDSGRVWTTSPRSVIVCANLPIPAISPASRKTSTT